MGTRKLIDSSAAFPFEVPGSNSPLVVQELQIGGTRRSRGDFADQARKKVTYADRLLALRLPAKLV
jgi:hypothetical protein